MAVFIVGRRNPILMASKKTQKCPKKTLQVASQVPMKTPDDNKVRTKASFEDEEDSEMERNFLFSKGGSVRPSERTEEETSSDEAEDEADNEDGGDSSEGSVQEQTDMTGSEQQRECKPRDTGSILQLKPGTDLSTLSFEEIISLQSKLGTKACRKLIHTSQKKKQNSEPVKRVTQNRPQEISAKKPVSFLRKVCSVKKPILRDPRFDDLSGEYNPEVFSQTYKFIDDIRQREVEMIKKQLKKVKSSAQKAELKSFLKRMENQKRNHQRREQQREKELSYKRKQRALVGHGQRPFYLKKSDQKKLQLAEKYSELKKSGKLDNFLSKKRKRNAGKDRRKMP